MDSKGEQEEEEDQARTQVKHNDRCYCHQLGPRTRLVMWPVLALGVYIGYTRVENSTRLPQSLSALVLDGRLQTLMQEAQQLL